MSTRRSARTPGEQSNSNPSSAQPSRLERSTRSHHKLGSPQNSSAPTSLSSGDEEGTTRPARRAKREETAASKVNDEVDEGDDDEEEVTRCICGHQEYPGPPKPASDSGRSQNPSANQAQPAASDFQTDDAGSLFIQCDICKVWQHGGCVGIFSDDMSPENYFCEDCKADLHVVKIGAKGQKYSRYLPVSGTPSSNSHGKAVVAKGKEHKSGRTTKESRSSVESNGTKRRSTMNSRAAYDEEEMVRRVIEESRGDDAGNGAKGNRKGKRPRDDSGDSTESVKRARTDSRTPSSPTNRPTTSLDTYSDDEAQAGRGSRHATAGRKAKANVAQAQREKELQEREKEKERERAEAAGRRKGRAERRRAEELGDDAPTTSARDVADWESEISSSKAPAEITPPAVPAAPPSSHHKKTGRPPVRRGKVGRNQYTRDKYPPAHRPLQDASPHRSQSRALHDNEESHGNGEGALNGNGSGSGEGSEAGVPVAAPRGAPAWKSSKPKYPGAGRTSMNEMRKRVAAILDFLSRTQIEMAVSPGDAGGGSVAALVATTSTTTPVPGAVAAVEGLAGAEEHDRNGMWNPVEFEDMSTVEMMDSLTRELVVWQKEFGGKVGEK